MADSPPAIHLAPVERDSLAAALAANRFVPGKRNFFIWEGVTEYLQPIAVDVTLRFIVEVSPPRARQIRPHFFGLSR